MKQRKVVAAVWKAGRLSRSQLAVDAGLTPNVAGVAVDELVLNGVLRECPPEPVAGAGRPRVPVELDPWSRHVVGLAINPGGVEVIRVGLTGGLLSKAARTPKNPSRLVETAAEMLAGAITRQTIGVGVSVTGFVDAVDRSILFSSSQPGSGRVSLLPVFAAADELPLTLENDMHALAARWLFQRRAGSAGEDVLLVSVADGRLGAAMLIDGRPNRGCITSANELGHTRFLIETPRCYCGHLGCLERIVSTGFLNDFACAGAGPNTSLGQAVADYGTIRCPTSAVESVLKFFSCGVANAVNFVRPHRLVVVNELGGPAAFSAALLREIRGWLLPELAARVQIEVVTEPAAGSAESAAWLAIAQVVDGRWGGSETIAAITRSHPHRK